MIGQKIIDEKPVSLPEVKQILSKVEKSVDEMDYVQKKAFEHAKKFAAISASDAKKMQEELVEAGLEAEKAVELVNLMPKDAEEMRMIFAKERVVPETETLTKYLDIVAKYK